jgi:hypothetical protein
MRRTATLLLLGLALAAAIPAVASAQSLLIDYLGFDYEYPDPNPATHGELGSGYVGLGTVPNLFAPLTFNTTLNEYTYVMDGLIATSVTPSGSYVVIGYSTGNMNVYEDSKSSGTPADYGTFPPNGTAPSSFTDGSLYLQGKLTNFQLVLNTANNTGSFEANFEVTGGTQFSNLSPDQRTGWTFSGVTGNALNIPAGYWHQVDGQTFLNPPTAVHPRTWGGLKALYR